MGQKSRFCPSNVRVPLVFNAPNSTGAVQETPALLSRRRSVPKVMCDNRLHPNHTQLTQESFHTFEAGAAPEKSPTVPRGAHGGSLHGFLLAARSAAHQNWKLHMGCPLETHSFKFSTRTSATLGQLKTPSKGCLSITELEQQL